MVHQKERGLLWALRNVTVLVVLGGASAHNAAAEVLLLVDRTDDAPFFVGSACLDGVPNDCSLRGAISHANSLIGDLDIVIQLQAGTYQLTLNGPGEDGNNIGDLDLVRDMTIRGQGPALTIVSGSGGFSDGLIDIRGIGTEVLLLRSS